MMSKYAPLPGAAGMPGNVCQVTISLSLSTTGLNPYPVRQKHASPATMRQRASHEEKPMQRTETVRKLMNAASTVRDIAFERRAYHFKVESSVVLYVHTEHSHVHIQRHTLPEIIIDADIQVGFGWRVETEQDADAVYLVAKRRLPVGGLAQAIFRITLPPDTDLILKLERCHLTLHDMDSTLHLPAGGQHVMLPEQGESG